jgi:hypothetical protein
MNLWGWTFLVTNLMCWAVFVRRVQRGPHQRYAVGIGVLHMLLATLVSVAPARSFFDPQYHGFALGLLRFEGRAATIPSILVLASALACASVVVSRPSRRGFWFVAIFDVLLAFTVAAGTIAHGDYRIQFGDALTLDGILGLAVMLLLFAGAPLFSAGWVWRQAAAAIRR